jgi:hypothetical protein
VLVAVPAVELAITKNGVAGFVVVAIESCAHGVVVPRPIVPVIKAPEMSFDVPLPRESFPSESRVRTVSKSLRNGCPILKAPFRATNVSVPVNIGVLSGLCIEIFPRPGFVEPSINLKPKDPDPDVNAAYGAPILGVEKAEAYALPVVVEFPEIVSPPCPVPFPIVEDAETRIPRVVVGRSEPATIDQSRNCEL